MRLVGLIFASGWLIAAAPAPVAQVHDGKLTVHAESAPLSDVLIEIGRQAGLTIALAGEKKTGEVAMPDDLVSDDFVDLPLEQGIARLLAGWEYSWVKDLTTGALKEVYLRARMNPVPGIPLPSSGPELGPPRLSERPTVREGRATGDPLGRAIDAARTTTDPERQAEALASLGNFQDTRTLEVLRPALQSDHQEVKRAVLEAMRDGGVQDPVALEEVRRLAEQDPDASVQAAALEVLVRYDSSREGRALLEKLAEEEQGVFRDFAQQHLQRMDEEEQASRSGADQIIEGPSSGDVVN